jgi:hypothetical protein
MPIHLLPSLNENSPNADKAGEWSAKDSEFLHTIATSLRKTRQGANVDDMTAVPDPWAQVMVFDAALFDAGHPLHPRAVGEWRGLLALFALAHQRSLNLSIELISLKPSETGGGGVKPAASFGDLVRSMRPRGTLTDDSAWDVIAAVRVNGRLAGLMTPPTLVCPTRDGGAISDQVTWRGNGRLWDPCAADGLNGVDYALIQAFCRNLLDSSPLQGGNENHRPALLRGLLESYLADLQPLAKLRPGIGIELAQPYSSLPPNLLYRPFQFQPRAVGQSNFHWGLAPRAEYAEFCKGALLIDPETANRVNQPAENIPIWRNISLDQIRRNPQLIQVIREEAAEAGYLTLTSDDLFTTTLCRLSGSKIVGHPVDGDDASRRHVLPLQPAALLFLTPEQLRQGFSLTGAPEIGMDAALSLPLIGDSRPGEQLRITRAYSKTQIVVREQPEALATWPDFSSPSWRYNFLFCFFSEIKGVKVKPSAISVAAVRDSLKGVTNPGQQVAALAKFAERISGAGLTPIGSSASEFMGIFHAETAIEAVHWNEAALGGGGGLILTPETTTPSPSDAKWMIGVDFGTTNTTVYAKRDAGRPKVVTFAKRLQPAFETHRDSRIWEAFVQRFALPDKDIELPFMSVHKEVSNAGDRSRLPVCTDAIDFILDPGQALQEIITYDLTHGKSYPPPNFNLKWSEDPRSRERMRLFLAQVVMQTLAEAMAVGVPPSAVACRFSYPEAFSITQRDEFSRILPSVLALAAGPGGERNEGPRLDGLRSESSCAGHYFYANKKAFFGGSVLTLDIGGNTTDITLWQANRAIWGSSVVLGGRHILVDYFIYNGKLLEDLLGAHSIASDVRLLFSNAPQEHDRERYINSIEAIINRPLPRDDASGIRSFWDRYDNQDLTGQPLAQMLELIAELALAGILHYVGNVMTAISRPDAAGVKLFDAQRGDLQICLGGNPSRLYKRLLPSQNDASAGGAAKARIAGLSALMAQSAHVPQWSISLDFSDLPKHEVAYGLLADTLANGDRKMLKVVIGEELHIGGDKLSPQAEIENLSSDQEWRVNGLPELRRFIAAYQTALGRRVSLTPDNERLLVNKVNQQLAEIRQARLEEEGKSQPDTILDATGDDARVMAMEPVFIIALRELIELLIRNAGKNMIAKV